MDGQRRMRALCVSLWGVLVQRGGEEALEQPTRDARQRERVTRRAHPHLRRQHASVEQVAAHSRRRLRRRREAGDIFLCEMLPVCS